MVDKPDHNSYRGLWFESYFGGFRRWFNRRIGVTAEERIGSIGWILFLVVFGGPIIYFILKGIFT
jgi:hypothetical protein